ncbi:hypothetical protein AB3X93_24885, partial [Paraburkholderia sp. BR14262]|uniref:hypothetical protein n=1 Tax=Paraburkholderia sp. BR14262 TaxID=3236999 RepID=UPI0034D00D0C
LRRRRIIGSTNATSGTLSDAEDQKDQRATGMVHDKSGIGVDDSGRSVRALDPERRMFIFPRPAKFSGQSSRACFNGGRRELFRVKQEIF